MPYLESSLDVMGQTDLLHWLEVARKTGVCTFNQDFKTRKLYVQDGKIVACESNEPYLLLGQFLISSGRIHPADLRRAMLIQERSGLSLGQILIESGAIGEPELQRLVTSKAEETVVGLSEWKQGVFRFVPAVEPPADAMRVELSIPHVLLEGARRVDEIEQALQTLGSPDAVLHRTDRPVDGPTVASYMARQLYDRIDGNRSTNDLVLQCRTSRYLAFIFIARLVQRGCVRVGDVPVAPPDSSSRDRPDFVVSELQQLVSNEHFEAALDLIDRHAIPRGRDDMLSMLIAKAEAGFVATAYRSKTPPDAVPHSTGADATDPAVRGRLSPDELFVLELVDGTWDVRSLVWISPLRKVEVIRGLVKLLDLEYVELRPPRRIDVDHDLGGEQARNPEYSVDDAVDELFSGSPR
jgi:hypothetical protein